MIENAHWFIHVWDVDGTRTTSAFVIREDTIVNGVIYKKLQEQDLYPDNTSRPFEIVGEKLFGLIREDTFERKVYYQKIETFKWGVYCSATQEELIYDFSLMVGDTVQNCGIYFQEDNLFTIDSIGTVNLFGKERKVLITYGLDSTEPYEFLVEGIGYKRGLLVVGTNLFQTADHSVQLLDYCVGTDWECGLTTSISELDISNELSISPNPVRDLLQLYNHTNKSILNLKVMSINGAVILDNIGSSSIDLSKLTSGVYIIKVNLENGYYANYRIVKI